MWLGESECVSVSPGCVWQSVCIIARHGSVGVRVCVQVCAMCGDVAWSWRFGNELRRVYCGSLRIVSPFLCVSTAA